MSKELVLTKYQAEVILINGMKEWCKSFKRKKQKSTRSLAQQMKAVQRKMRKNKPNKNYQSLNHSKFILVYHIIFVCKYRKKLLIKYGKDIKQIMFDISKKYDFDIKEMEVDKDHIHMMINSVPKISPL